MKTQKIHAAINARGTHSAGCETDPVMTDAERVPCWSNLEPVDMRGR
jgi:hypothetical protein